MDLVSSHIYIHYPVCKHVCSYCDFTVISQAQAKDQFASDINQPDINQRWLSAIKRHFEASLRGAESFKPLETIYFGGGTPSLLPISGFQQVLEMFEKNQGIDPDCEITIEANPETISVDYLKSLKSIGVNRLSLGIQTTKPEQLRRLERLSTSDAVFFAVENALKVFSNISVDLMIGIPEQNEETLDEDLSFLEKMNPPHVSAYILTLSPDHIWFKNSVIAPKIASPELVEKLYAKVTSFLESRGYLHYEVSNFAKPGFESKHNKNYWDIDSSYGALGPGAHGYLQRANGDRVRTMNEKSLEKYFASPETLENLELLNDEQRNLERLYMKLRTRQPILLDSVSRSKSEMLFQEGLCCAAPGGFILSDKGWLLIEKVAEYLV